MADNDVTEGISMLGDSSGGGFLQGLKNRPELTSIALDMLGSKLAPESPFAGMGTFLGASSLAKKAEDASQARATKLNDMLIKLIESITAKDKVGPTTLTLDRDDTGNLNYNIKGMEDSKGRLEIQEKLTGSLTESSSGLSGDFLKDFGG